MPESLRRSTARLVSSRLCTPVDRLLHVAVETLHAEAGAGNAGLAERLGNGAGEAARVDLDRNLGGLGNLEVTPDRLHQAQELVACEDGRRAAAEMNVGEPEASAETRAHQRHFQAKRARIGDDRFVAERDTGVAAAIPAHAAAEGDVDIERADGIGGEVAQPLGIAFPARFRR